MVDLSIIKILSKEKGISLRELSIAIGISEQGLHKLIKENSTKVDTLDSIAKVLNVPISVFFQENSAEPPISKDSLIESQQRTIETLSRTIENLTKS